VVNKTIHIIDIINKEGIDKMSVLKYGLKSGDRYIMGDDPDGYDLSLSHDICNTTTFVTEEKAEEMQQKCNDSGKFFCDAEVIILRVRIEEHIL
jgi:hypothetical protein